MKCQGQRPGRLFAGVLQISAKVDSHGIEAIDDAAISCASLATRREKHNIEIDERYVRD